MKTITGITTSVNKKAVDINSQGRIEVTSDKLKDNPIFNKKLCTTLN